MADDAILKIILRYVNDPAGIAGGVAGADKVTGALKRTASQAAATETQLRSLKRAAGELTQVGHTMTFAGLAIAGPFVAAAKAWVDASSKTSGAARDWVQASRQVESSYLRVGRVAATVLLPSIKQTADLTDKLATFIERNPDLVRAVLAVGGGLAGAGALVTVAGSLAQSALNIALLAGKLGVGAGGAPIASTIGYGGAALGAGIGAAAPLYLADSMRADLYRRNNQPMPAQGKTLADLWQLIVNRPQGESYGSQGAPVVGLLQQIANNTGALANDRGDRQPDRTFSAMMRGEDSKRPDTSYYDMLANEKKAALPLFMAFQRANTANGADYKSSYNQIEAANSAGAAQAESSYNLNRLRQVRDFNQNEAQIEASYNSNRLRQLRDFQENEAQALVAFNENQAKAADAHALDMARADQDHADDLKRMAQDHAGRSRDLAAAGDALGFVKEKEQYQKQVAESNANAAKDKTRREQDYVRETEDARKAFEEQRQQRLADFGQQQADAKQAFDDEKRQRDAQFQQQLRDEADDYRDLKAKRETEHQDQLTQLGAHYIEQKEQIKQAFIDQLNAIDPILTGMTKAVQTKMQKASDEFQKFLDGVTSQTTGGPGYCGPGYHWDAKRKMCVKDTVTGGVPAVASGGYAGYGLHMLGEGTGALAGREFVLNALTTRTLEQRQGGPLSQSNILNMDMSGMSVGGGGGLGGAKDQILNLVDQRLTEAFTSLGDILAGPG